MSHTVGLGRRRILCGAAAAATALAAPAIVRASSRELRMAWWGGAGRHEATLKAIRLFERRHPGLRIRAEYMGFNGYLERLTTQIAGRSEPDVMQINWAWLAMFSKRGTGFTNLEPHLPPHVRSELSTDDYESGMVLGKLNALPASYTARVLFWNQDTFRRAGVPLPTDWESLLAAGPIFRKRLGPDSYPLDGELYDMMLLSLAWLQQRHGVPYIMPGSQPRIAMSTAIAAEWISFYRRLVDEHVCTSLPLRASLGGAEKPTEQQTEWVRGRWAGNYTWDSVVTLRASTLPPTSPLALGDFPMLPSAVHSGMFGRPSVMFAVGRNCPSPDVAASLIAFLLTDPEAVDILGRTRGLPSARSALTRLEARGQLPALEVAAHAQIRKHRESGRIPLPAPLFEHPRLHRFMREVFEQVAYRKIDTQAAAARLVTDGGALLQRLR